MKFTKSILFALFVLLIISGCGSKNNYSDKVAAQLKDTLPIVFEETVFFIPSNFYAMGYTIEYPRSIMFLYKDNFGKTSIAFSDNLLDERYNNSECDPVGYMKALFEANTDTSCNSEVIDDGIKRFISDADTGFWQGKKGETFYYSVKQEISFLFVIDSNRKLIYIQLDAPNVTKEAIKAMVEKLLYMPTEHAATHNNEDVLYARYREYGEKVNAENINSKELTEDYFVGDSETMDMPLDEWSKMFLLSLFKYEQGEIQGHYEKNDGQKGCLALNIYKANQSPSVFVLSYEKSASGDWLIAPQMNIVSIESTDKFVSHPLCPDDEEAIDALNSH